MAMRSSKTRIRITVLGLLLLLVNASVFALFTWPRLTLVRRAEARAREVAGRKAALEEVWEKVVARREAVTQNRRDIETLSRDYLKPRETDLFQTQREIESLALASGLRPKKSSYALEDIKGTGLVRCEITLPLDGRYADLTGFLARLERSSRFIVVDQMALSRDPSGARMNLELSAVFTGEGSRASR